MTQEALKLALEKIATVNAMDYEYQAWAREALAQTQEPVATVESVATVVSESGNQEVTMSWWHEPALPVGTKLYTTPPQRTWVGLTDDELTDLFYNTNLGQASAVAQAIALLKEKNT